MSFLGFGKSRKDPAGPSVLTSQNVEQHIKMLELRCANLEQAIIEICFSMRAQIDRLDTNQQTLDKNMHSLAALTLRSPKDLLGGTGQEPN